MNAFGRASALATTCWRLLWQHKEWLNFPLVAAVATFVFSLIFFFVTMIFGIPTAIFEQNDLTTTQTLIGVVAVFIYYFVVYFLITYTNAGLIAVVLMKLRGEKENPTAADGYAVANKHLGALAGYAGLSATVGMIARMVRESARDSKNVVMMILASILASIIEGAWALVTMLVIPVIIIEKADTLTALKRSWALFKQTWGENVIGGFALGFVGCLLTLAAIAPGLILAALGGIAGAGWLTVLGIIALIAGIVIVSLFTSAAGAIFQALLYQYATQGNLGGLVDTSDITGAFTLKAKRT